MNAESGNPFEFSDTIVAQATAPGRGALAIIRVAGPDAHFISRRLIDPWPATPRAATLARVRDGNGAELDQSIIVRYDAPASFTGEDAVEIMTHGGAIVPTTIIGAFIAHGARLAHPGEFSRRAVLNGKLDILQAEAAGDLVSATSRSAQRSAMRQLDGGLSRRLLSLRDDLIGLEALIAYDIDFPEEDDGPIAPARILAATNTLIDALERLVATAHVGELVRHGALVVVAGTPNVGKSSLFNALIGETRAIVTNIPGTTRDAIEAVIDTPSIPLRLVDTAGVRESSDSVERMGIEVSAAYITRAAVILACADDAESATAIAAALSRLGTAPVVAVRTKADLRPSTDEELASYRAMLGASAAVGVSAETGAGIPSLIAVITEVLSRAAGPLETDAPILTHERHRHAVSLALDDVRAFRDLWHTDAVPAPVAAVHLRSAVTALEDLIGGVDVEEILDEVFRRFCVGK